MRISKLDHVPTTDTPFLLRLLKQKSCLSHTFVSERNSFIIFLLKDVEMKRRLGLTSFIYKASEMSQWPSESEAYVRSSHVLTTSKP